MIVEQENGQILDFEEKKRLATSFEGDNSPELIVQPF